MMNKFIYVYLVLLFTYCYSLKSQSFSTSLPGTVDLTGANATCATATTASSPNRFSINVSGITSSLTSTMALGKIVITLDNSCTGSSANLNLLSIFLRSPNGTCVRIYAGGLTNSASGIHVLSFVSNTSCANIPSTANSSGNSDASGNGGIYVAYDGASTVNLTTLFSGQNPNGTWSIFFAESTVSEPCLVSASLVFGNPTVTDQTSAGDNCTNAVNWDGSPTCASTNTKTPSSNMPGWAGPGASTFGTFAGGATCAWNGNNDNDTWIRFTAQSNTVCVNVSSLDQNTQSIVVTDSNIDGDNNPCTGSGGGQYWELVSCPRPSIYGSTAGSNANQNHCFIATPGQTYYLVVDGNGGAESPFFINGLLGTQIVLPIALLDFDFKCDKRNLHLNWSTQSELNNDYYTVMASTDGNEWVEVTKIIGAGNSNELRNYQYTLPSSLSDYVYYKLKQTDTDGKYTYSKIIYANCSEADVIDFFPNPFEDVLSFKLNHRDEAVVDVYDNLGQIVYTNKITESQTQVDLCQLASGVYYLKVNQNKSYKIIKK